MMLPPEIPNGPFTWRQVAQAGMSRHRLDALVAEGRLIRVLRGVYQPADLPNTLENRCRAAALVVTPLGVLCDRTAAWVLGVQVHEFRELEILPKLEIVVPSKECRTIRRECLGGERDLAAHDIWVMDGVRLTSPLRTALDLACKLTRRRALAALDAFMRVWGITTEELLAELPRYFRRRGVIQARRLVLIADPRAESPGESWTRLEIHDAGLPVPQPNYWVVHDGRELFRLDLAYPKNKVCVEYDGEEFHSTPDQRRHDQLRRDWLRAHGWTVIVVDKHSFTPEALSGWLGEVRSALRLAA